MEHSNEKATTPVEPTIKIQDQTPISILIEDFEATSNLIKSDSQKKMISVIVKELNENCLEIEREIMVKFAFDFYYDLSRQIGVPENLISENITHAEMYFDEKFSRNKNV